MRGLQGEERTAGGKSPEPRLRVGVRRVVAKNREVKARADQVSRTGRIDVNLPGWEFALATFVLPAATAQSHQSDHAGPGGKKQSEDQAQQIKPLARRVRHKRLGQGRA